MVLKQILKKDNLYTNKDWGGEGEESLPYMFLLFKAICNNGIHFFNST